MGKPRVLIVGAGIGGVSAGYRLKNRGFDVTIFDSADYIGGRMKTISVNGFNIDVGAGILPGAYKATKALIREAGLESGAEDVTGNFAFLRSDETHLVNIGSMQTGLLTSGLLGLKSKLQMIKPMLKTVANGSKLTYENAGLAAHLDTETVTEYCERELSQELLDYFFGPFVRTMYLQPPEDASIAELFWCIKNLTGQPFSLTDGMQSLPTKLAESLDVQLNSSVDALTESEDGVSIEVTDAEGNTRTEQADYALIATDSDALSKLYGEQLTGRQREYLDTLQYSFDAVVTFCLSEETAMDATLVQVPESTDDSLAAIVIDHKKGAGRTPPGKGMVTSHFLNDWNQKMQHASDEELIADATRRTAKVIPEVETAVENVHIERWPRAATMSVPGTFKKLAGFMEDVDQNSRVQLAGDYMSLSSVNVAIRTAEVATDNIAKMARA